MEREIERIIRSKVHEAESMVVTWRKDRAWYLVSKESTGRPARWYAYAAGLVILLGAVSTYWIQRSQHQKAEARIAWLQNAIRAKTIAIDKANTQEPCETVRSNNVVIKSLPAIHAKRSIIDKPRIEPDNDPVTAQEIPLDQFPRETTAEAPVIVHGEPVEREVYAIVGFVPRQTEKPETSFPRKFKLRLQSDVVVRPDKKIENKVLTARIH